MGSEFAGTLDNIGLRDNSLSREYLIFGPPGTGKTRNLARQVRRAAEKYGPGGVIITSYSRAAAAELTAHDLPVIAEQIGTLHSFCWRALGRPRIAEVNVAEWNQENPTIYITPVRKQNTRMDGEEAGEEIGNAKRGDVMLQLLNRHRGLMASLEIWPVGLREFAAKWERYKRIHRLLDFCDLIEIALRDLAVAPGGPAVIVADEVQDLNPLQSQLIQKWGERCEYFLRAGDDDQTIYSFAGASPETMLHKDIPDDHKIFLKQSHRLPAAIHEFAEQLIRRVSRRQDKTYSPRNDRGAVHRIPTGYKCPEYQILRSMTEHLSRGKTIMLLATCSYMLQPLIQVLRKNGIPFHNPYRRSCGFWNPLRPESRGSAVSRIRALLAPHPDLGNDRDRWTHSELALWSEWLAGAGVLKNDVHLQVLPAMAKQIVTMEDLAEIFDPKALGSLRNAFSGSGQELMSWWQRRVHADFNQRTKFAAEIVERRGVQAILDPPRVIVGTIHSVKGGQADVVYLFPDLSQAGDTGYQTAGGGRDSVTRLFYVGVTRARETLYICNRETARSITL